MINVRPLIEALSVAVLAVAGAAYAWADYNSKARAAVEGVTSASHASSDANCGCINGGTCSCESCECGIAPSGCGRGRCAMVSILCDCAHGGACTCEHCSCSDSNCGSLTSDMILIERVEANCGCADGGPCTCQSCECEGCECDSQPAELRTI